MPNAKRFRHALSLTGLICCGCLLLGMGHLHEDRPESYPALAPFKVNDGTFTYVVNMNGLRRSPTHDYSDEDIARIEDAIDRAFQTWAEVLAPLNLKFKRLPKWRVSDLPVITFNYERFIPACWRSDTIAGAHSLPILGLFFTPIPIILDSTERFEDLSDEPAVVCGPMAHPYTCFTASQAIDVYSVALHEIGHVFGAAHPTEAYKRDASYNFLALDTVRIDARCLEPSEFLCGEHIARRRPILRTELDSVMRVPLEPGARFMTVTPADRAFVAFALRYLNPEGADAILAQARQMFLETSPLRFANVFEEYEKDPNQREDNDTIEHAQAIEPNSIILGSIAVHENDDRGVEKDVDVYRIEVTEESVGATWYFDIDYGGGLVGPSWVDAKLELLDETGQTIAENDDANEIDANSLDTVDPFLTHQFDTAGTYYIRVTSEPPLTEVGSAGDYELKVGVGGVPEPHGRRDPIPALVDPSVAGCLGLDPTDTSLVPCQTFGILAMGILAAAALILIGPLRRHITGPRPGARLS